MTIILQISYQGRKSDVYICTYISYMFIGNIVVKQDCGNGCLFKLLHIYFIKLKTKKKSSRITILLHKTVIGLPCLEILVNRNNVNFKLGFACYKPETGDKLITELVDIRVFHIFYNNTDLLPCGGFLFFNYITHFYSGV